MRTSVVMLALMATALTGYQPVQAKVLKGHSQVVVAPFEGHPGDRAYLSGSGFPPHRLVSVVLACPSLRNSVSSQGSTAILTNARGQFVADQVRVFRPKGKGVIRCAFYAGVVGGSLDSALPAPYLIVPARRPLAAAATHIRVRVRASLIRLSTGAQGTVVVSGWPGARTVVQVVGPGAGALTRTILLDWHGNGSVRLKVAPGLLKGVQALVRVQLSLGPYRGQASTRFIVVPGGR